MQTYINTIKIALIIFIFLAFFISLPFFIIQYRKYGRFLFTRGVILYSFIFYLLCAYLLVILPLPTRAEVAEMTGPYLRLIPGASFIDFLKETVFNPTDIRTYIPALKQHVVLEPLFNILMLVPFGVYLRYYFKLSFKRVVLYSFLLSLFFELTQLSGLYFIYPRPYRLFDVNDLIHNTLGGIIGYAITPLLTILLPSRKKLDEKSIHMGERVTYVRRGVAVIIDWGVILLLKITIISIFTFFSIDITSSIQSYLLNIILIVLYFMVFMYITNGQTIGKKIVKIRVVQQNKKRISFSTLFKRYGILYLIYLSITPLLSIMNKSINMNDNLILATVIIIDIILIIIQCSFIISIGWSIIRKKPQLFYEKQTHTYEVSTLQTTENVE